MNVVYVVSNHTGTGKTALCTSMVKDLRSLGKNALVFKLLTEDPSSNDSLDQSIYRSLLDQPEIDNPFVILDGNIPDKIEEKIKEFARKPTNKHDLLILEGTSNVANDVSSNLANILDAKVLVVTQFKYDLKTSDLEKWKDIFKERIIGFLINGITKYRHAYTEKSLLPSMNSSGLKPLGAIPEDRGLLALTVRQLASHLKGKFTIGEEHSDQLVEYFLVGAIGMDNGAIYFGTREKKAVIVRGDRPDIQMSALQTDTECLILTQGIEPIEYVLNEAELQETPIIVVESNTLETMDLINTVLNSSFFDHKSKLNQFSSLLKTYADTHLIYSELGLAN